MSGLAAHIDSATAAAAARSDALRMETGKQAESLAAAAAAAFENFKGAIKKLETDVGVAIDTVAARTLLLDATAKGQAQTLTAAAEAAADRFRETLRSLETGMAAAAEDAAAKSGSVQDAILLQADQLAGTAAAAAERFKESIVGLETGIAAAVEKAAINSASLEQSLEQVLRRHADNLTRALVVGSERFNTGVAEHAERHDAPPSMRRRRAAHPSSRRSGKARSSMPTAWPARRRQLADRFKATVAALQGDMSAAAEDTNAKGTAVRKAMLQAMQLHADSLTTAAAAATDRFKAAVADMQAGMDSAAEAATAKGTSVQDALLGAVQLHADGLSGAAATIVDQVRGSIVALQDAMVATMATASSKSAAAEQALQQQAESLTERGGERDRSPRVGRGRPGDEHERGRHGRHRQGRVGPGRAARCGAAACRWPDRGGDGDRRQGQG